MTEDTHPIRDAAVDAIRADLLARPPADGAHRDTAAFEHVVQHVVKHLRVADDGKPEVARGVCVTVSDLVNEARHEVGGVFAYAAPISTVTTSPAKNLTAHMQAIRAAEVKVPVQPPAVAAWKPGDPNPYRMKTYNMTKQMLLTRHHPEIAARLKAEAGRCKT